MPDFWDVIRAISGMQQTGGDKPDDPANPAPTGVPTDTPAPVSQPAPAQPAPAPAPADQPPNPAPAPVTAPADTPNPLGQLTPQQVQQLVAALGPGAPAPLQPDKPTDTPASFANRELTDADIDRYLALDPVEQDKQFKDVISGLGHTKLADNALSGRGYSAVGG